jgi:hypothetical protein
VRSGKSIVQLAGHDIVSKAMKSVDITARDHDVRIKANVNLQLVSDGRVGEDAPGGGGIILESLSPSQTNGYSGKTGEGVKSTGIILKAANSRVLAEGSIVHLASPRRILIDGKDASGSATGALEVGVKTAIVSTDRYLALVTGQNAGLIITRNIGVLAGRTVALVGGRSSAIVEKGELWQPLAKVPLIQDPYPTLQSRFQDTEERYIETNGWLDPYSPAARLEVKFTYRSSKEYGTISGTEVYQANKFFVYEAAWALMAKTGHALLAEVTVVPWDEYDIADTMPWPGAEVYDQECYVTIEGETNIGDPKTEVPVERSKLKNQSGGIKANSFHEYEVVKVP